MVLQEEEEEDKRVIKLLSEIKYIFPKFNNFPNDRSFNVRYLSQILSVFIL